MNKLAKLGLLASASYVIWSYGALAQQIPSFPNATTPFTGGEQTYLVQGGASKNMTLNQLATWAGPTTPNTTTLRQACTSATSCPSGDPIYASGVVRLTDGAANAAAQRYLVDTTNACSADDGGACITSANSGFWEAQISGPASAQQWGVVGDGSTNDTTAFNNAINWCNSGTPTHARVVDITGLRIIYNSSPTLSAGCTITGPQGFTPLLGLNNNPSSITGPSAILLNTANTITVINGSLQNLRVIAQGLTPPTSFQDDFAKLAAFSGTGVTVGDGSEANLSHLLIVGFAQCIGSSGIHHGRDVMEYIWPDCTNDILVDNAHDVDEISHIRGWEYFDGNLGGAGGVNYGLQIQNISAIANNGSGALRVTVPSTANMATGNTILINQVLGALGANGQWTITVVNGTQFDLQGSSSTTTNVTGTLTSGQGLVTGLSSVSGIWTGEAVSGTGIPANTTVVAVDFINNNLWLSNLATASGSQTITATIGSYTSGGSAILGGARSGTFVKATNSEEVHYTDLFQFGWKIGYNPSTGTQWQIFHNIGCDGEPVLTSQCILDDGDSFRAQFIGVNVTGGPSVSFDENTSAAQGALVRGMYIEGSADAAAPRINVILHTNADVDIDGRDNSALQYVADYDTAQHRFAGLFTNTHLLDAAIPTIFAVTMPQPIIVGTRAFVPGLTFGGGNAGLTCSVCAGQYTISPDGTMTGWYNIGLSAVGSATGVAAITGLPAPCSEATTGFNSAAGYVTAFTARADATATPILSPVNGTSRDILDLDQPVSTGFASISNTAFGNTSHIIGTFSCSTR